MELTEIGVLLVEAESNYGVDPTPAAADVVPTIGDSLSWSFDADAVKRRPIYDGARDPLAGYSSLPNVTLKFAYELRGNGTIMNGVIGNKIEIDALLLAADLAATYTAEVTPPNSNDGYVIYKPANPTAEGASVTCSWYTGLKLHKLTGGKVDVDIVCEAGKMAVINFTVRGKYVATSDASVPGSITGIDIKPPSFENATVTFGSYTGLVVSRVEFALGNSIVLRPDALTADGVKGFVIGSVSPTFSLQFESGTIATQPAFADWRAATINSLVVPVGATAGNKFTGTFATQVEKVGYGNDGGRRITELSGSIVRATYGTTAGNHFQLKFA